MKEKKKRGCCVTILAVPIALIVLLAAIGSLAPEKEKQPSQEVSEVTDDTKATEATEADAESSREKLIEKYGFTEPSTVDDDVTGNWRLVHYSATADPGEFIIDYYKSFFESNDEIHILINDTANTVTTMRCTLDNYLLSYEIHEYVDGEESSAKTLGNGEILGQYLAYVETGEIEELDPSDDELTDEQRALIEEAESSVTNEAASDSPSVAQSQAVKAALSYLEYSTFSATGLIDQLKYEGFSEEDARAAVESLDVDWAEQARRMAEEYLAYSAFSASGLVGQLVYDGFDDAIAQAAVDSLNINWTEQAVKMGQNYLEYDAFSESGLKDQLVYEGFSEEDAAYAASECFK